MSQTGNYKLDANHIFGFICAKLYLTIENDNDSFLRNWKVATGLYKGYNIILTRKDSLEFIEVLIYKYHEGNKISNRAEFGVDIIQIQGIDACIGMLAREIEKAIAY